MSTTIVSSDEKKETEDPTKTKRLAPANENRFQFVDLLKALAILLVILNHKIYPDDANFLVNGSLEKYFNYYLFASVGIAVPLFFLVNGMLLLNRPMDVKKHYKKIFRIAILGILWGAITTFFLTCFRQITIGGDIHYTWGYIARVLLFHHDGWLRYLWFMKVLAAIYIVVPLIKLAYDYSKTVFLHIFFFVFSFVFIFDFALKIAEFTGQTYFLKATVADYNIFAYHHSFALVFFMTGGLFFHYKDKLLTPLFRLFCIAGVIFATLCSTFYCVWYSRKIGSLFDASMEHNSIFQFVAVLCLAAVALTYKEPQNFIGKLIQTIGRNSLGIYLLHVSILEPIRSLAQAISLPNNLLNNLLIVVVTLFLSLGLCLVLKKIPIVKELFKI